MLQQRKLASPNTDGQFEYYKNKMKLTPSAWWENDGYYLYKNLTTVQCIQVYIHLNERVNYK